MAEFTADELRAVERWLLWKAMELNREVRNIDIFWEVRDWRLEVRAELVARANAAQPPADGA